MHKLKEGYSTSQACFNAYFFIYNIIIHFKIKKLKIICSAAATAE